MTITKTKILQALPKMDDRERDIITRYYGLGNDLPEPMTHIAKRYGVSSQRVSKIRTDCEQKILAGTL
jgi:DNA-directed RNA polymerase sigma subunit (sigma70/sigma32)